MLNRLDTILNIRPDERRTVYLMLAQYFFLGAAMLFAQTISMPLFLEYWDASYIPLTYIGIAIVVSSITAVFLKISSKVSLARWLWLTLFFIAIVTLFLRLGLAIAPSKWLALLLPIWTQTLINLAVLAFWTLASDTFDVRQGKRLFGLLNAGSWLSYVVAGPFTGTLANALGTENLYIVVAICFFIAIFIQSTILKGLKKPQAQFSDAPIQKELPVSALFRNRYIILVFALAALWRVAYFVMDAIFYNMTSILARVEALQAATALVVIAGMEGALPSVVAGLLGRPVFAVPTSVGYGAHLGGVSALLSMLNSCSPGVSVVNIDNGFSAAFAACQIVRAVKQAAGRPHE